MDAWRHLGQSVWALRWQVLIFGVFMGFTLLARSKYPLSETGLSQKERLQARLTVGMIPILVGMVGYAIWKIVQNQYTMLDAPIMVTIVALATVMSVAIVHVVRKINPRRGMNLDVFLNTLLAIILASSFEHAINEEWTLGYLAFIILMSMASELADVPRTPEVVPAFDPPFQQPPFHQGPPAA